MPEQIPSSGLDDSFEDWNGAELKTCSDLVSKMTLSNTLDQKILFKIKLSVKSEADIPNLRWPVNGIRGVLNPNETAVVALLQKILPTEGMGNKAELEKLDVNLSWKFEPSKSVSKSENTKKGVSFDPDVKQVTASNAGNQDTQVGTAVDAGVGTDQALDPALYEGSAADLDQ